MFSIGVVISTYNNPCWLEKTLWGYVYQTHKPDEIIIADDGSTNETKIVIDSFRNQLPIKHVWHEDNGFQKSQILNKALLVATADYLIFTDQDCIPHKTFVATHYTNARKGHYISGGKINLTAKISKAITIDDIVSERIFSISWLIKKKQPLSFKLTKLLNNRVSYLLNRITPTKPTWNGCNSSGWRTDLLEINGFNEDMHYGGQDCEFGERLLNMGIKPIQLRYLVIVVHLYHDRPYKTTESIEANIKIRKTSRTNRVIKTPCGISQNKELYKTIIY